MDKKEETGRCSSALCTLWEMRGSWEQLCDDCLRSLIEDLIDELNSREGRG